MRTREAGDVKRPEIFGDHVEKARVMACAFQYRSRIRKPIRSAQDPASCARGPPLGAAKILDERFIDKKYFH